MLQSTADSRFFSEDLFIIPAQHIFNTSHTNLAELTCALTILAYIHPKLHMSRL